MEPVDLSRRDGLSRAQVSGAFGTGDNRRRSFRWSCYAYAILGCRGRLGAHRLRAAAASQAASPDRRRVVSAAAAAGHPLTPQREEPPAQSARPGGQSRLGAPAG